MPRERDPFHKYVEYPKESQKKNEWRCKFCDTKSRGHVTRIRAHLAGISGYGIKACEKVDPHVKAEAFETFNGKGSVLDKSTGGTSGEGTEGTVFGASQNVLPCDDASNPNDMQNSNRPACAPQQQSFHMPTATGTAQACPQDDDASNPNHTQNSNQLGCTPQQPSFYQPTGTGTAPACPQDDDASNPNHTQNSNQRGLLNPRLDAAHGNEIASSLQQLPMGSSASSCLDFSQRQALHEIQTHLESETEQQNARGLSSFPNDEVCGNSMPIGEYLTSDEHNVDGITLDSLLDSTCWSDLCHSLRENLPESHEAIVNTFEEIQTNELHNPMVGSSLQIDSSRDVDRANRLQDCAQPCMDEVVPVRSNTSPTDAVQHPGQLPPRCDKEDGNDIRQFPSRTPMDIDPSTALQHSSDSHIFEATTVDSLVPEASTNPIGSSLSHASVPPQRQSVPHQSTNLETAHQNPTVPSSSWENHLVTGHPQALMDMDPCMPSSSQAPSNAPPPPQILPCGTGLIGRSSLPGLDMNEGVPMMSHPNTGNNFEENRDLKRKRELIYEIDALIKFELEYAALLRLKKLRMEVANWLADVEKLRCTEASSEDCLPQRQWVDTLMHAAEDLTRLDKGLFEVRETKVGQLLEDKMVGEAFQINTTKILKFLVGNQISLLGIYGMGGVGKTTIMAHVHNKLLKVANYGNVLWITVSQDFNTQRLQDDLWKALGVGELQETDVMKRAAALCDRLTKSGKSTIILDDVWKDFDLKEVGIPDGIKLVLTTRSIEVCRGMGCQEMIKIEPLSKVEAESLFLEELGSKVAFNLETEAIMKSVVQECAGLPLAIITMARSMRGVTDDCEWKDSLGKLRDSNMKQTDMEEKVLKKLEFSYNRLPNHEVQQCFLSCALYPEDKLIAKFELIEFFIDQGLFGQLETRERQYFRGHTILNKLANVCLLEDHGREMKMHDLIRDMALRIMSATSIVKAGKGLKRMLSEEYWTDTLEKVSLMENNIEEFPLNMSPNCPKVSTFLLNGNVSNRVVISIIPNSFFKQLWGLKVLNLSGSKLRELPDSISDLVNLRALLLERCWELCHIPYLGKLTSLRKLDMYGCAEVEAIKGLEMLVELRYLDIGLTRIKRVPKGTLGTLRKLQYLRVQAVNEEDIIELCALEALKCKFEDVDDFNRLVRVVNKQSNNLRYYRLHMCQKQGSLYMDLNENPFGNFERSVHIEMETTGFAIVSAGRKSSGSGSGSGICILFPQNVQTLSVRNCDGATNSSDMGLPQNLEKLTIDGWKNLRVLSGREDEEIINIHDSPTPTPTPLLFRRLGVLSIHTCQRLKYLFGHGSKLYLPHLRKIRIVSCEEMVGITVAGASPSPHLAPAFPSLVDIHIWGCYKMKRVVESEWLSDFRNLRRIQVSFCKDMEEIIGSPPPYMPVEEISLEELSINSCDNLRRLFPHELLIHLRNLQTIGVHECKGIVEMISRVGQGQEGSITTPVNNTSSSSSSSQSSISLPKLKHLWLSYLPQLKSICDFSITCDSLEDLGVEKCPKLNKIPLQLQLRNTENLPYIRVEGEEKWKTLIWDQPDAQAILQSHLRFRGSLCILESRNSCWSESVGELSELPESEGELSEREGELSELSESEGELSELSESEGESSDADFEEV